MTTITDISPDATIRVLADSLEDQEATRKALANRIRSLHDMAGIYNYLTDLLEVTEETEKRTVKELERAMKAHPLYPWIQSRKGVGPKAIARLLGTITSEGGTTKTGVEIPPSGLTYYWRVAKGATEPERVERNLYKLFAYCGFDPGQKKVKGQAARWNHAAKMRLYVISESAVKKRCAACIAQGKEREGTEWLAPPADCTCLADKFIDRHNYDKARLHWEETRPDATSGHKANHALRMVSKGILKDMYNEALILGI